MFSRTKKQFLLLKREYKHAKVLAKMAKMSEGTISRIIAGEANPTWRAVKQLALALRELNLKRACGLLAAYLGDIIPRPFRQIVRVQINGHPNLSQVLHQLSPEAIEMIEKLARLCAENEAICHVFAEHIKLYYEIAQAGGSNPPKADNEDPPGTPKTH